MNLKKCNQCNTEKELKHFTRNKLSKDGYLPECKPCRASSKRASVVRRKLETTNRIAESLRQPTKADNLPKHFIETGIKDVFYDPLRGIFVDTQGDLLASSLPGLKVYLRDLRGSATYGKQLKVDEGAYGRFLTILKAVESKLEQATKTTTIRTPVEIFKYNHEGFLTGSQRIIT